MVKILDGKKLAEKIFRELSLKTKKLKKRPYLAVILVGDDLISKLYIKQKEKACLNIGIGFRLFQFSQKISREKLKKEIKNIVDDTDNSGVVIQLPLPRKLNEQEILNIVSSSKDLDVLSEESFGKFYSGDLLILPPVVGAVFHIFKEYGIKIADKNIVLVGSGRLVGKPLNIWFLSKGMNITVINKSTKNSADLMKKADIIISGVGKPNIIKGFMVKKGVVVIDVGTSILRGKLSGDVDFKSVSEKASHITPVPGGIGPVTVACLLENLIKLAK